MQHDIDTKHIASTTKDFILGKSSIIYPIEQAFHFLMDTEGRPPSSLPPRNKQELKEAAVKAWKKHFQ